MTDVFTRAVVRDSTCAVTTPPSPFWPIAALTCGSLFAGLGVGAVLGLLGAVLAPGDETMQGATPIVLVAVGVVAVVLQWCGRVTPLPERHRQVPRRWLLWRSREATGLAYGLMLGAGVLTRLQFAAIYVLALLVLLAGSSTTGAAIGALYGGLRAAPLIATWVFDRWGPSGRRLDWEFALAVRRALDRVLAGVASASLAGALSLTYWT